MDLYFLVIVDAYSKWIEVATMHNPSTKATIDVLSSLFARYGLCEIIVSGNGTQFTSTEFSEFCARNGIKHITTSPGHPQTTPHATTNASPAELFLKRQLRSVLDLLRPNTFDPSHAARHRYKKNFDQHTKERYFQRNDKVLVRDFRNSPNKIKWTPGVLVDRHGSRIWTVNVGNKTWRRHENQMKHREWSSDEDVITMESTTTMTTTNDRNECSTGSTSVSTSSSDQSSQVLRHSSRSKKPVKRWKFKSNYVLKENYIILGERRRSVWILLDQHYICTSLHPRLKRFDAEPHETNLAFDLVKRELLARTSISRITTDTVSKAVTTNVSIINDSTAPVNPNNLLACCFDKPRAIASSVTTPKLNKNEEQAKQELSIRDGESVVIIEDVGNATSSPTSERMKPNDDDDDVLYDIENMHDSREPDNIFLNL
ncbi:unnamed protein product [Rotaria magnacalcarata]|uniref:Integrase catalytic domain-containing protein n=1 Tax=Rotaria magnacalcarata TaxID=392030 RepID=A0A816PZJ6_9BILA|nr:unnamed protein product [Rotaria magnacalcarata]